VSGCGKQSDRSSNQKRLRNGSVFLQARKKKERKYKYEEHNRGEHDGDKKYRRKGSCKVRFFARSRRSLLRRKRRNNFSRKEKGNERKKEKRKRPNVEKKKRFDVLDRAAITSASFHFFISISCMP